MNNNKDYINRSAKLIEMALNEDIGTGDITTLALIREDQIGKGKLVAKEDGIIAGLEVFENIFKTIDGKGIEIKSVFNDGDQIQKGDVIAEFSGSLRTILTGERTALNFLQRMSGVATKTKKFVDQIEGTSTQLLDTRKTIPGFRYLDKYAVTIGSGKNHRIGLFDMIMLKENHIKASGSIKKAVESVKKEYGEKFKIEVETREITEVVEALDSKIDIIMLDNMSTEEMAAAIKLIGTNAKVEASGNITIDNIRKVAETGVDYISVGAITHSVSALDISLLII
ncbi:MAG: carboxylating nicotinate-nucleotide diphosphorylase [Bacteroidota bacterium]